MTTNRNDIKRAAKIIIRYVAAIAKRYELQNEHCNNSWWDKKHYRYGTFPECEISNPLFPDELITFAIRVQGESPDSVRIAIHDLLPQSKNIELLSTDSGRYILNKAIRRGFYHCILFFVGHEKGWQFDEPKYYTNLSNRIFHQNNDWKEEMIRIADTY